MESFDGLAVLSTNLRANLDEAFTRRLDAIVDFPTPTADARRQLWANVPRPTGAAAPTTSTWRSAPTPSSSPAATSAASPSRPPIWPPRPTTPVTMATLIAAVGEEYRKLGRLCLEAEFGPYHHLAAG